MGKIDNLTFAAKAQAIIGKYKDKVDKGDVVARNSLDRELKTLSDKQEQAKQQMQQQQQSPAQMMRYGGGMGKRRFGGDDPTKSSDLNNYTNVDFTGTWQDDPSTPNIDESKDIGNRSFKVSKTDGAKMRKANEIFRKHQETLRGVRSTRGGDVKTGELKSIIGPEAYNELESAYNTLTSMSTKYGVPAQSFGINDTGEFGGSNLPQWYGYRFDSTKWNFGETPQGEPTVEVNANQQNDAQYEYYNRDINPYQINPKYDIGSAIASTRPLLKERNNVDPLKFDRVDPGYINLDPYREQVGRDATTTRNVALNNIRNTASGAGSALANATAAQTEIQSNVNKALLDSNAREVNANAGIYGRTQAQNANIQKAESMQNYQDRKYVDENEKMRMRNIGANTSGLLQRLKGNEYAELGLQSYNPDYMFDENGIYQARRGVRRADQPQYSQQVAQPANNQAQLGQLAQPTIQGRYSPEVPNPYDQGFQDIEIDQPLQPIEGQPLWKYKCGGKLKKK